MNVAKNVLYSERQSKQQMKRHLNPQVKGENLGNQQGIKFD
jgi:hypothetical protein